MQPEWLEDWKLFELSEWYTCSYAAGKYRPLSASVKMIFQTEDMEVYIWESNKETMKLREMGSDCGSHSAHVEVSLGREELGKH